MIQNEPTIVDMYHPSYSAELEDWGKWRSTYKGSQTFINKYLQKFSSREDAADFAKRKCITYNPAFAKIAINEIINSICQRLPDITRSGGSESYQRAMNGEKGGVDLMGNSMDNFLGEYILAEMLPMKRVGVFVDMPPLTGETLIENHDKRPYLYVYKTEEIQSWTYNNQQEFTNLLLKDYYMTYDEKSGLSNGQSCRYRHLRLVNGIVYAQYYTDKGGEESDPIILNIPKIPFYIFEIRESLLVDVADYQIALLNLASSDMAYALHSNYPFYTEQFDPRANNPYVRKPGTEGTDAEGKTAKQEEIKVGTSSGRRYPAGLDRPEFIHPSSDPLKISMEKQEQLKLEIRQLVQLTVSNLQTKMASAESKKADNQGLEAGLSYIGLELESGERKIAEYWNMYEKLGLATVKYPENYSLKTDDDRQNESKNLRELQQAVPSKTYQKAVAKRIAKVLVGSKVSNEEMENIEKEIESADCISPDVELIAKDVEIGILDLELASKIRGYPKGTVEKAKADHAERLARITASQTSPDMGARGVPILDPNLGSGKIEKKVSKDTTQDPIVTDKIRGEGK